MAIKKIGFIVQKNQDRLRLDQVLAVELPILLKEEFSKGKIRKLIIAGAVYLNGKRIRIASKPVFEKAKVEVYFDRDKFDKGYPSLKSQAFVMSEDRVLFEDQDIIVVNKPPGLPSQPTLDEARINLFAAVKKFLSDRDGTPNVYLGMHHRLDRDTSGAILFTKSKNANAGIAEAFSKHLVAKTYVALAYSKEVEKHSKEWVIENYLGKLKNSGKASRFGAVKSGGDFAQTKFKIIGRSSDVALIEAQPKTGRTHQIRVHLAEDGLPILGDAAYGGTVEWNGRKIERVMLHAAHLSLLHPVSKVPLSIPCSVPQDFGLICKLLRFSVTL